MDFVALSRRGGAISAQCLNTGIVKQNVQLALPGNEVFDGGLDSGQVTEIKVLEDQRAPGLRPSFFDVRYGSIGFVFRSGSDVDFCIFGVQYLSNFLANTCVGPCDNINLY